MCNIVLSLEWYEPYLLNRSIVTEWMSLFHELRLPFENSSGYIKHVSGSCKRAADIYRKKLYLHDTC